MTSAGNRVAITMRGRGTRDFPADELLLVSADGDAIPDLIPASQVRIGDFVAIRYGWEWPTAAAALPVLNWGRQRGSEKQIQARERMTNQLAFLLGAYLSEGHTTRSNWSVIVTNSVMSVLERTQQAWRSEFGLEARITRQPGRCTGLVVSSKRLVEFMDVLGCGSRAANKRVPDVIMRSTQEHVLAFLQGAALDACTTTVTATKWAICLESAEAIDGLQELVTRLSVPNAQIPKFNRQVQKTYFELYAPGRAGQELCARIPFLEPNKAARAAEYMRLNVSDRDATDVIPGVKGADLYELLPTGTRGRKGKGTGRQRFRSLCDPRTRHITRAMIARVRAAGGILDPWLDELIDAQVRFVPVVPVGKQVETTARPQTYSVRPDSARLT